MTRAGPGRRPGAIEWLALALLCGCATLSGVVELLLVPLYIGRFVIPIAVLAAVVTNLGLPIWGYRLTNSGPGAVLPVACWLVSILVLSMVSRPEGDLFVLGAHGEEWNFYALLFLGAVAGFGAVVKLTTPSRAARSIPGRPGPVARSRPAPTATPAPTTTPAPPRAPTTKPKPKSKSARKTGR